MVHDISYTTIDKVIESWEELRRASTWECVGKKLFQKFFIRYPDGMALFGFSKKDDPFNDEFLNSKRFLFHATNFIKMFDTAMNLLGPDSELLTEVMHDLGIKHVGYGVKAEMYPILGECLLDTIREILTDDLFDSSVKEAWKETYYELSQEMIRAEFSLKSPKR